MTAFFSRLLSSLTGLGQPSDDAATAAVLVAGIAWTAPFPLGAAPVAASGALKVIGITAGHQTGDEALVQAARWLENSVWEADVVARYGGEEFLAVLADTGLADAEVVIGRCLNTFRTSPVPGWPRPLTASAGLTAYSQGEPVKDLLQRVDAILHRAKAEGRNRIITG
jgi:diguanylate cyclase (GGDEF)-like protein